jgi:hypothetical protein
MAGTPHSIIRAASIGGMYDGKEIDIQEGDEAQGSEGQSGARSGQEHDHDFAGSAQAT